MWLLSLNLNLAAEIWIAASRRLAPQIPAPSASGRAQRPSDPPIRLAWEGAHGADSANLSHFLVIGKIPRLCSRQVTGRRKQAHFFSPLCHQNPYSFLPNSQLSLTVPHSDAEHPLGSSSLSTLSDPQDTPSQDTCTPSGVHSYNPLNWHPMAVQKNFTKLFS